MIKVKKIKSSAQLPEWLLKTENKIFGNFSSCPKTQKAQQKVYPFPGKLFYIEIENCIPSFLYSYKLSLNAIYIWACGTLPKYRGKGYFSELLSAFYDDIEHNYSVFFVSANKSIEKVFISNGFKKRHSVSNVNKELIIKFNKKLIQGR